VGGKQGNAYLLGTSSFTVPGDERRPCSEDSESDLSLLAPQPQPQFGKRGPINIFAPYSDSDAMLDRARAQLQKHLAADIRLQQASERQRQLDARELSIRNVEATLKTRVAAPSAKAPVDDTVMATELVRSLVSEPEDKAAAKMASVFKSIRASAPQVDAKAIVKEAADEAVRTIAARDNDKALGDGLDQFTKSYPDIAGDSDLFALADRRTTAIAEANPSWAPGKVMLEAGKQTREWLKSMGAPVKAGPGGDQPSNRQQRKQNLVPMPQARSARPAATDEAPRDQTPQDAMAEIRKSRGQAY